VKKIVKIGPVDPEIAWLNLKKETEGKIYSPVGNVAERAKKRIQLGYTCSPGSKTGGPAAAAR